MARSRFRVLKQIRRWLKFFRADCFWLTYCLGSWNETWMPNISSELWFRRRYLCQSRSIVSILPISSLKNKDPNAGHLHKNIMQSFKFNCLALTKGVLFGVCFRCQPELHWETCHLHTYFKFVYCTCQNVRYFRDVWKLGTLTSLQNFIIIHIWTCWFSPSKTSML